MKKTKLVCLFTALILGTMSVVSCNQNTPTDETSSTETEVVSETQTEAAAAPVSSLPDDLNLQGLTVRVLHGDDSRNIGINHEETTGDLLNDTIYETNSAVMEDLNFKFQFITFTRDVTPIEEAYVAGDDSYEIVLGSQVSLPGLVVRNMLADLDSSSGSYIDFDAPWWYENYIEEARVHEDKTFFLAGDASMGVMNKASIMVVNTDLMEILGKDMDDLYETVLDGKWTFDAYNQLKADVYIDENGDGIRGVEDTYGFATNSRSYIEHFFYNSGVPVSERDGNGFPKLVMNNEKTVKSVEYLYDLFIANSASYYTEGYDIEEKLGNNTVLTFCYRMDLLMYLRDYETNYAVIPEPKLDETVASYASINHDEAIIYCIPVISANVKNSTAVLEALGYAYYENVMPVYYEQIIKSKYRRDSSDYAAQMLDIIHDNLKTDFSYIYSSALSGLVTTNIRDLIGAHKSADFVSSYMSNEQAYLSGLEDLIEAVSSFGTN